MTTPTPEPARQQLLPTPVVVLWFAALVNWASGQVIGVLGLMPLPSVFGPVGLPGTDQPDPELLAEAQRIIALSSLPTTIAVLLAAIGLGMLYTRRSFDRLSRTAAVSAIVMAIASALAAVAVLALLTIGPARAIGVIDLQVGVVVAVATAAASASAVELIRPYVDPMVAHVWAGIAGAGIALPFMVAGFSPALVVAGAVGIGVLDRARCPHRARAGAAEGARGRAGGARRRTARGCRRSWRRCARAARPAARAARAPADAALVVGRPPGERVARGRGCARRRPRVGGRGGRGGGRASRGGAGLRARIPRRGAPAAGDARGDRGASRTGLGDARRLPRAADPACRAHRRHRVGSDRGARQPSGPLGHHRAVRAAGDHRDRGGIRRLRRSTARAERVQHRAARRRGRRGGAARRSRPVLLRAVHRTARRARGRRGPAHRPRTPRRGRSGRVSPARPRACRRAPRRRSSSR